MDSTIHDYPPPTKEEKDESRRITAMYQAAQTIGSPTTADELIKEAKKIEAYLKGEA